MFVWVEMPEEVDTTELLRRAVDEAGVAFVPGRAFCARGGVFNLFVDQEHVRFEVNPGAADRRGLQLSSSLLRLARRGPGEPGAKGR